MKDNVVSLFAGVDGPSLAIDMSREDRERVKQIMADQLRKVTAEVEAGEVNGIVLIAQRTNQEQEVQAESYLGGEGVFDHVDRTIGLLEMVKFDLIVEMRKDGG